VPVGRLPNLLVAGVPKAGTGSLFAYMTQHPDICRADQKEIGWLNYYNPLRYQGDVPPIETYMEHFADCGDQRYAIDATPTYSYGGKPVVEAVRKLLGEPKIIITLRNPVDEYLTVCEQQKRHARDLVPRDHLHGLYIGFYADYLGHWLEEFGDDLRVVFADDMLHNTAGVIGGIFDWLDIDSAITGSMSLAPRNTTQHARSPRVAKVVFSAKRQVDRRLGRVSPAVRQPLRRAYEKLNAGQLPERLEPPTRQRVEALYRDSNRATAQMLIQHGYSGLPPWLAVEAAPE
jgi:hypothetical protein